MLHFKFNNIGFKDNRAEGLLKSQTRDFEVNIPELSYTVAKEISTQEIFAESAY